MSRRYEEGRKKIYKCIERLAHAKQCDSLHCSYPGCFDMKSYFHHYCSCLYGCKGGCSTCTQLIGVCVYHTKTCRNKSCGVPFCPEIKAEKVKMSKVPAAPRKPGKSNKDDLSARVNTASTDSTSSCCGSSVSQSQTSCNGVNIFKSASLSTKQLNSKKDYDMSLRKSLEQLSDESSSKQRGPSSNTIGFTSRPIQELFNYEPQEQCSGDLLDNVINSPFPLWKELITSFFQEVSRDPVMRGAFENKCMEILTKGFVKPLTTSEGPVRHQGEPSYTRPRSVHADELQSPIQWMADQEQNNLRRSDSLPNINREQSSCSNNSVFITKYLVDPFL